jgi:hypothetical protein
MKSKYEIGTVVHCSQKCIMTYIEKDNITKRILIKENCDVVGRIVGMSYRREGTIEEGHGDDYQRSLAPSNSCPLWKVATSMMGPPIEVMDGDIQIISSPVHFNKVDPTPIKICSWRGIDRARLSGDSTDWPRDKKGRWSKT